MSTTPIGNELSRWFDDCVLKEFQFLILKGFECVRGAKDTIRYVSSISIVEVYRDGRSNEISLQVTNSMGTQSYSMSELIRLFDGKEAAKSYRDYASHTWEGVKEGVHRLASRLQKFIDSPEWNGADLFERLEESGKVWAREYSLETQLDQVRKQLELAWHSRDYGSVIKLLQPFEDRLSSSELKKLEYAKNR